MLAALTAYLPELSAAFTKALPGLEQGQMDTRKQIAPQEAQLSHDLYKQYGPLINQIGQDIYRSNQEAQTKTDAGILAGSGKQLTQAALENAKLADPEYYATRAATAKSYTDLLSGLDPNNLHGGELASVERGINRANQGAGLSNAPSAQAGLRNALGYSDRINAKRGMLTQALGNAPGVAQSTKSGVDPYMMATGKASAPQFGAQALTGTQPAGFGQSAGALTGSLLGQIGDSSRNSANINAQRRDELDRFNQTFTSVTSGLGSLGGMSS